MLTRVRLEANPGASPPRFLKSSVQFLRCVVFACEDIVALIGESGAGKLGPQTTACNRSCGTMIGYILMYRHGCIR